MLIPTPGGGIGQRPPDTICVDLDGTLVRTDTLVEGLLRLLHDPRNWAGLPGWLLRGRAALKRQVTARAALDVTLLPYEHTLVDYLRAQRACGRRLVLATAADRHLADGINAHLRLFDEVIASATTSRAARKQTRSPSASAAASSPTSATVGPTCRFGGARAALC